MKINQIFILRFIAAILVVLYHYDHLIFAFEPFILNKLVKYGNEAVNFFFFLSGFIMVIAHHKYLNGKELDKRKYWINRFERIYPVYFLAIVLLILYFCFIDNNLFTSFPSRVLLECSLLQGWIGKTSLNYPGWSLSVELLFYICFPFLFSIMKNKKLSILFPLSVFFYIITQVLFYFLKVKYFPLMGNTMVIISFPLFHISTFIFGIVFGLFFTKYYDILMRDKIYIKLLSYFVSIVLLFLIFKMNIFSEYHYVGLLTPVYFCFLLAFSLESKVTRMLSNPLFIFLGDISYSIYIFQFPLWLYFTWIIKSLSLDTGVYFYMYIIFLILFSSFIFWIYEKPAKKIINSFVNKYSILKLSNNN